MKDARRFGLMAAMLAAVGAFSGMGQAAQAATQASGQWMRHGHRTGGVGGYRNRSGWTDRRYRRAALKKRNKARHRAACRGRKA